MKKSTVLHIITMGLLIIILVRFYYLQIHQHQKYETKADYNSIRKISLNAPRGIIFDRNDSPLVDNRKIYDLSVIPFDVTKIFDYGILSDLTGLSRGYLKRNIMIRKESFNKFRPYTLKRHIDFETRSQLEENKLDLPGTIFSEFPARTYPNNARLTHVIGYLRELTEIPSIKFNIEANYKVGDIIGFSGIEKMYESLLRGKDGLEFRLVDIYGIDHGVYNANPGLQPTPGNDLQLTINSKLQSYIENIFITKRGAAICMHPKSGEVLAFVSAPDYDLQSFAGPVPIELWEEWNQNQDKPLLNRVIQGLYPPGSPFKLIAIALALEDGKVHKTRSFKCNGRYQMGDRIFHCWNTSGHGNVDMTMAIYQSCNIYFYHLMQQFSFNDWVRMSTKFGFGTLTGIDLYGEKRGNVPSQSYMDEKYGKYGWAAGNLLTFVIGQGDVLVTPIQIAQMMNLIATRGNTKVPHLYIGKEAQTITLSLKETTWEFLANATWEVVNNKYGTGKLAKLIEGNVHGKTGTAQNPHGEDHSWFAGYLVLGNNPVLSIAILVEHGGKGSVEASSIAGNIFNYVQKNITFQ